MATSVTVYRFFGLSSDTKPTTVPNIGGTLQAGLAEFFEADTGASFYWNGSAWVAKPASTAVIGKVGIDQTTPGITNGVTLTQGLNADDDKVSLGASATGGATPYTLRSAASTNGTSVKASAGTVYTITASNENTTTARYLKFYNKASAPTVGTDVPNIVIPLPKAADAESPTVVMLSGPAMGWLFSTGIALAITGGEADSDTTAVSAGDVRINIAYK